MISVMMLLVVATVFATVVVGMLNDHRHLPPSHFAVASIRFLRADHPRLRLPQLEKRCLTCIARLLWLSMVRRRG
jgi:hypothetical protein